MVASYSRKSGLRAIQQDSRKCILPFSDFSTHGPTASLARAQEVQQYPSYSPKQTLRLLFKEKRTAGEQRFVQSLLDQSELIAYTHGFIRRFRQILTERDEAALPLWAREAEASQIPELKRFVQRLRLDWEAVENALLFASSQGQVEGQVNRLKVFKRQGYGRAHALRNEMRLRLKWLHRPVQSSRFFLAREQKYLCLMETSER